MGNLDQQFSKLSSSDQANIKRMKGTERQWNAAFEKGTHGDYMTSLISNSSTTSGGAAPALGGSGEGVRKLNEIKHIGQEILATATALTNQQTAGDKAQELALNLMEDEAGIRKKIVQDLGQTSTLQERTTKSIFNASIETAKYGIETKDLAQTLSDISDTVGRNISFTDKEIERLAIFQKAFHLTGNQVGKMVKQFDQMGFTIDASIDKANEMANVARTMGVNMSGFMDIMSANMDMLNTYNFADGVKGFAKMAANSERLGISMASTAQLAEKVMDPEGAIELAANLQVIGGAVGDLADPFKLMYMATNDLGGLQDALIDAGQSLTVFNEETGEIEFPPTAQRQLRAMAETLGIGKEEFAGMIKMQAKFESAQNQMNLSAFTGPKGKEMREFVAGMAKMGEKGQYVIELEDKKGKTQMVKLADLTKTQVDELKLLRKEQEKTKEMSEKDVAVEQLSTLDAMLGLMKGGQQGLKAGIIENLDIGAIQVELSKQALRIFDSETIKDMSLHFGQALKQGIELVVGTPYENLKEKGAEGVNVAAAVGKTGVGAINDLLATVATGVINIDKNAKVVFGGAIKKDDFTLPADGKEKLILGGPEAILSNERDTIGGWQGGQLANTMNNATTTGQMAPVTVKFDIPSKSIPITLNGTNMGDFNWQQLLTGPHRELFLANLKVALHSTDLTGTQSYKNVQDAGGII